MATKRLRAMLAGAAGLVIGAVVIAFVGAVGILVATGWSLLIAKTTTDQGGNAC